MTQTPKQTTQALLARAASDFQGECNRIAQMALADGEVPPGSRLDLSQAPVVWVIPDIQPGLSDEEIERAAQEGIRAAKE